MREDFYKAAGDSLHIAFFNRFFELGLLLLQQLVLYRFFAYELSCKLLELVDAPVIRCDVFVKKFCVLLKNLHYSVSACFEPGKQALKLLNVFYSLQLFAREHFVKRLS